MRVLSLLIVSLDVFSCQIFQEVPMGIPMMMPMSMPYSFYTTNPFDQGIELEYSPITQLVSSIAHLVEMHQKSRERSDEQEGVQQQQNLLPEMFRRRPPTSSENPRFNLIPYTHEGLFPSSATSSGTSSTSRIVNSIPTDNIPSVMWRIGDLIGKGDSKQKENVYDTSKIKGFPITKNSEDGPVFRDETKTGEKKTSWTILEIARKILGLDEIPTAEEGNAIVQLMEQIRKEKKEDTIL